MPPRSAGNAIAVRLPLAASDTFGYTMLTDIVSVIKQNLKTLILTVPGERVMAPNYGIGVKKYLFENFSDSVFGDIDQKIREQSSIYLPAIRIIQIKFDTSKEEANTLNMFIMFSIPSLGVTQNFTIPLSMGARFSDFI
mgnify:CR=1 FL=1